MPALPMAILHSRPRRGSILAGLRSTTSATGMTAGGGGSVGFARSRHHHHAESASAASSSGSTHTEGSVNIRGPPGIRGTDRLCRTSRTGVAALVRSAPRVGDTWQSRPLYRCPRAKPIIGPASPSPSVAVRPSHKRPDINCSWSLRPNCRTGPDTLVSGPIHITAPL